MRVKSQSQLTPDQLERLNRARDFFGDPRERWNNRLVLHWGVSKVEEYLRGRMAIILQCQCSPFSTVESESASVRCVEDSIPLNGMVFLIIKANLMEFHRLNHWDEKLMFVPVVQVMEKRDKECPIIPSMVGSYTVQDKLTKRGSDLLLFDSYVQGAYKFLPRICDWEETPLSGIQAASVEKQIKCTPQIMECVANYQCATVTRKFRFIDFAFKEVGAIQVVLSEESVEVRIKECLENRIGVLDVLLGPFNLEP